MNLLVLLWLVAAMLSALMVSTMAMGISDAVLAAELTALAILVMTAVLLRRQGARDAEERRILRAHRERRGY
jgi:hypothetical protein